MEEKITKILKKDLSSEPQYVMDTASEALSLLGHYSMDFKDREEDQEDLASLLRIIADYLHTKATLLDKVD